MEADKENIQIEEAEKAEEVVKNGKTSKKSSKKTFKIQKFNKFKFPSGTYELEAKPEGSEIAPLLAEVINKKTLLQNLINEKVKRDKDEDILEIAEYKVVPLLEFYIRHHDPKHPNMGDERCCICIFEFFEDVDKLSFDDLVKDLKEDKDEDIIQLEKCEGHYFHLGCVKSYLATNSSNFIKCPICCYIYGVMTGDMPHGTMTHTVHNQHHCDTYNDCGTIMIQYCFPSGKLPNGKRYQGTNRTAYLPDNEEGRDVFRLLKLSFDRRLTFTIGTSITTGQSDCVIWNGIHHKTHTHGGPTSFGYPDPTYFNRVKLELANKGVL